MPARETLPHPGVRRSIAQNFLIKARKTLKGTAHTVGSYGGREGAGLIHKKLQSRFLLSHQKSSLRQAYTPTRAPTLHLHSDILG